MKLTGTFDVSEFTVQTRDREFGDEGEAKDISSVASP
jgi:hypothetical protein